MTHRPRTRISAFTLVELLVVITVICVLIAMLLPALGSARTASQSTLCVGQVRQVSLACNNYATDYTGQLPRYDAYAGNPYSTPVLALLAGDYLPRGATLTVSDDYLGPITGVVSVPGLRCPGEQITRVVNAPGWNINLPFVTGSWRNGVAGTAYTGCGPTVWDVTYAPIGFRYFSHYQFASAHAWYSLLNHPGTAPIAVNDGLLASSQPHVKLGAVVNPGQTWLVFDGNDYRFSAATAVFRHPHVRANFAYIDGHAGPLGMLDIDGNPTYPMLTRDDRSVINP